MNSSNTWTLPFAALARLIRSSAMRRNWKMQSCRRARMCLRRLRKCIVTSIESRTMPSRFHERFEITIGLDDVKERFVNRIGNRIFNDFFEYRISAVEYELLKAIADELGDWFTTRKGFEDYTKSDFHKTLQALEGSRRILIADLQLQLDALITKTLNDSELDLGVRYENGVFVRTGTRLLDRKLVNESLRWLSDKKYESVLEPFSKGLDHLLKSEKYPAVLSDVVTDMYERLRLWRRLLLTRTKICLQTPKLFLKETRCV